MGGIEDCCISGGYNFCAGNVKSGRDQLLYPFRAAWGLLGFAAFDAGR